MDAKERGHKGGEIGMAEKRTSNGGGEVLIAISNEESKSGNVDSFTSKGSASNGHQISAPARSCPSSPLKESSPSGVAKPMPFSYFPQEVSQSNQSSGKPPKSPASHEKVTRRKSLTRSVYSKPKSRFGEPPQTIDASMLEENSLTMQEQLAVSSPYRDTLNRGPPINKSASSIRTNSMTPKTPLMASPGGPEYEDEEDKEDEEIVQKVEMIKEKRKRIKPRVVIEWLIFLCILGCLVAGLTVEKLERLRIWGLEFWKWCVLVMVIFSGMLVTNKVMHVIVFLIERNFLLRRKVLYFVHGLKKSVQVFIWIGLVLLAWTFLFNHGVERTKTATKILNCVTWTLVSLLIGSFLWLLKTLLLKILASSFHVKAFFDRIQESVFHQYILQTLSGPPVIEEARRFGRSPTMGTLSVRSTKKGKGKAKKVIDMGKVHQMKQEKVSAWTMKVLVDAVTNSRLSTISNVIDECGYGGGAQTDGEITNEMEATAAAFRIFQNVAQSGCKYIDEEDLLRFLIKEEVDLVFPLIEGSESGRIDRKALTDWVVKVYNGRKALAHALSDTKTAVKQLSKLVTGILVVVTIVIWLLLIEVATTKILVVLSSQLVVAAFMFGNTCKTIFEAIIFVFVMHPFDVGDRVVVDGVPLLVEEMNILTTVFLKLDSEKVYYPNSVLSTKPISNYYRSSNMGETVEFSIDFATPVAKIGLLRDKIKEYLDENPQHWHPTHTVVVKEIENVNKLKMALYSTHTMNFQEYGEKNKRKTELVMAIKRIFEDLKIKYYLLPQRIHVSDKELN